MMGLGGVTAALGLGGLPWRWVGIGAAVLAAAGLYLYVDGLHADVARLRAEKETLSRELDEAVQAAEVNAAAVRRQRAEHARQLEVLRAERDSYAARVARLRQLRKDVNDAPSQDDAPVAPVLRDALDGLRRLGAGAGGGDEG